MPEKLVLSTFLRLTCSLDILKEHGAKSEVPKLKKNPQNLPYLTQFGLPNNSIFVK